MGGCLTVAVALASHLFEVPPAREARHPGAVYRSLTESDRHTIAHAPVSQLQPHLIEPTSPPPLDPWSVALGNLFTLAFGSSLPLRSCGARFESVPGFGKSKACESHAESLGGDFGLFSPRVEEPSTVWSWRAVLLYSTRIPV